MAVSKTKPSKVCGRNTHSVKAFCKYVQSLSGLYVYPGIGNSAFLCSPRTVLGLTRLEISVLTNVKTAAAHAWKELAQKTTSSGTLRPIRERAATRTI